MIDPYLDTIGLLLARPSAKTEARLRAVEADHAWRPEARQEEATLQARDWCSEMLAPAYRPPDEVRFVPFDQEEGVCDTVRCEYTAGELTFHIAQSKHVACIHVRSGGTGPASNPQDLANRRASQVFVDGNQLRFSQDGTLDGGAWGKRILGPGEPVDPDWPNWREEMRWWNPEGRLVFLTLKTLGGPTKAVIHPAPESNRSWFGR